MSESSSIYSTPPINRRPIQLPTQTQYRPIQLPNDVVSQTQNTRTPIQLPTPSPIGNDRINNINNRTPIQLPVRQPTSPNMNTGQYKPIQLPTNSLRPIQLPSNNVVVKKVETDWVYYLSVFLIVLILILTAYIIWHVFFVTPKQVEFENNAVLQDQLRAQKESQLLNEKKMLEDKLQQEKKRNEEQEMKIMQVQEQKKEPEKMNFDIVYDSPKYKDNSNSMKYMMDSDELGNVFLGFWEDLNKRWTAESMNNGKYFIKYDDKCLMLNDSNNIALKNYSKDMEDYMTWNLIPFKDELKKNYSNENDLYFIDNNINTPSNVLYNEKTKSYLSVNNSGDIMGVIYPNSDTLLKTE
jgi:hypothetical protein